MAAVGRGDPNEALGLVEGQRAQQDGMDDAEDDDVGPDAEGKDQDGDGGEAAIAAQGAQRVAEILRKALEA